MVLNNMLIFLLSTFVLGPPLESSDHGSVLFALNASSELFDLHGSVESTLHNIYNFTEEGFWV